MKKASIPKRMLSLFLAVMLGMTLLTGVPLTASATGSLTTPNGLTATIGAGNTCAITGYSGTATAVSIPQTVLDSGGIQYTVTEIAASAFQGKTAITSVSFPNTLTTINASAFSGCTSLKDVTLPDSITNLNGLPFTNCPSLRVLKMEGSVPACSGIPIDAGTMILCKSGYLTAYRTSVLGTMRCYAYDDPTLFHTAGGFYFKADTKTIVGYDGTEADITIPASITVGATPYDVNVIGGAFFGNTSLTSVTIPATVNDVKIMGAYGSFDKCTNLKKVTFLGNAPTGIDEATFEHCASGFELGYIQGKTGFSTPEWYGYRCFVNAPPREYNIAAASSSGGTILADKQTAAPGATVSLTVTPSGGNTAYQNLRYNDGTGDKPIIGTSFTMPAANVVVSANFYAPSTGTWTTIETNMTNLRKVAAKSNGDVYVCYGDGEAQKYSNGAWSGFTPPHAQGVPVAITFASDDSMYVETMDTNTKPVTYKIYRYPHDSDTPTDITGSMNLVSPNATYSLCFDNAGVLYAITDNNKKIHKYANDTWSEVAPPPSVVLHNTDILDITVDSTGHVYALDNGQSGSEIWKQSGGTWSEVSLFNNSFMILAVAAGPYGEVYATNVSQSQSASVWELKDGTWSNITGMGSFSVPLGLYVDPMGAVYVADFATNKVQQYQASRALSGTVALNVNSTTGEVTASATGGNTASFGTLTYTWSGGAGGTGAAKTPTLGTAATCTVTAAGATGSLDATVTVYKVALTKRLNTGADAATISSPYGKVGDSISIAYTLAGLGTNGDMLTYSGVANNPAPKPSATSGGSAYVISAGDAKAGIISLTASFGHRYGLQVDGNGGIGTTGNIATFAGEALPIQAGTKSGFTFSGWVSSNGGSFSNASAASTSFTMPYANTKITANWTQSSGGTPSTGGSGGSGAPAVTQPSGVTVTPPVGNAAPTITGTTTATATSDASGMAKAAVSENQLADVVKKAVEEAGKAGNNIRPQVKIKVSAPTGASAVETSIPSSALKAAASGSLKALEVSSPVADISFDAKALATISEGASKAVSISASTVGANALSEESKKLIGDRPVYQFSVKSGENTISQFNGTVTVAVPYTPKAGEDINAIVIYFINANGAPEVVKNGKYDPVSGKLVFTTNHFSTYAVGYHKVSFQDVPSTAWYSNAVSFVAARGITTGLSDEVFAPDASVSRAQFLVMVMRAYGIPANAQSSDNFVDAGMEYYTPYLAAAKEKKLASGIGENRFEPNRAMTRQEMASMLYTIAKSVQALPEGSSTKQLSEFKDASQVAPWAQEAMALFVKTGTLNGSEGYLDPTGVSSRAQLAQLLYQMLGQGKS